MGRLEVQEVTHDKLLAKLLISDETDLYKTLRLWQASLYAIVELHKPRDYKVGNWCIGCNANYEYPCPTIQAIEKEIG